MHAPVSFKIGIDIGGTFTDVTIVDANGRVTTHKTSSTPHAPAEAVLTGIRETVAKAKLEPGACTSFIHGSTVGVNTVIQRTGAKVGLIITKGFEDLLEVGRTQMPDPFSLFTMRPIPLARKDMVRGVEERIDAKGRILIPLDEAGLRTAAAELVEAGVDGIALVFLNSYRNAAHEQRAREVLTDAYPDLELSVSTDVWPQVREYERATVLAMNTYIAPKVKGYLAQLQTKQNTVGLTCPLYMTSSNGGIVPLKHAIARPIGTLLSGPASGIVATLNLMRTTGLSRVVTMDIGGTSADLCVLDGERIPYAWDHEIDGLPVTLPSVDVSSIGAGGGSIAYADNMGLMRVGPQSAGANPGPAAYDRGGKQATLTDAYLMCGFINPDSFGGNLKLNVALARDAIRALGDKLNLGVAETASGVVLVATSNLAAEFTRLAAKKGIDPREYTLVPFGGAGATHACLLADETHIRHIAIPISPGNFCATGSVLADFRLDYVHTTYAPLEKVSQLAIDEWVAEIEGKAKETLAEVQHEIVSTRTALSADVRYLGQGYEVSIPFQRLNELPELFRKEYEQLYGPRHDEAALEVISVRATVIGATRKISATWAGDSRPGAPVGKRTMLVRNEEYEAPVYLRSALAPGWKAQGPFIVDQPDTTCVVTRGWRGEVDEFGTLHLRKDS